MARTALIKPFGDMPALAAAADAALDPPPAAARPATDAVVVPPRDLRPLGQILIEDGTVDPGNLLRALVLRRCQSARLGEILLANGWVQPEALLRALSRQWRTTVLDLAALPPDPRLVDALGAPLCLAEGIVPWRRVGGVTFIATARPEGFAALQARLPAEFGATRMLLCSENAAREAVLALRRTALARQAETGLPPRDSCRTRNERRMGRLAVALIATAAMGLVLAPGAVLVLLTGWAVLTLAASAALKMFSFAAILRRQRQDRDRDGTAAYGGGPPRSRPRSRSASPTPTPLPVISVMVPLFAEADIAGKLIARLSRLDYPRELTDILIVVEETDRVTCQALEGAALPRWLRVVKVPDGPIRTKPRALNYALNFCRGTIVGVWDAEDRPEPDQLHKVARGFHLAPPEVACLQGVLDYYNPRSNWLARAFTIEYAAWFRATLAGAAALDLVVPLGGTTLFFRRDALEEIGAWDAWNVTEDADLGVRLTRRGYRTRMLDTVTHEEANCRLIPWVKQRSRWLKGFAMTWGVHMRDPAALWRDLGARRFIGLQAQLFASVSQYLLAPVLWSFWLLPLGLPHPLRDMLSGKLGGNAVALLFGLFVASELLNIAVGLWAVRGRAHRHLLPWVPTLHLYFPLGCLAAWKAIYEVVAKPFYWDKTQHGLFEPGQEGSGQDGAGRDGRGKDGTGGNGAAPTPDRRRTALLPLWGEIG